MKNKLKKLREFAKHGSVLVMIIELDLPKNDPEVIEITKDGWISEAENYLKRLKGRKISEDERKRTIYFAGFCARHAGVRVEKLAKEVGVEI